MIKEFKVNDILSAVNSIAEKEIRKDDGKVIKRNPEYSVNRQVKTNKSEILVLEQMIE
jgi:hypothetical protein